MDYDEEMVKRMLGKCPDEDMARKTLNALVRTTTIPVEKVVIISSQLTPKRL